MNHVASAIGIAVLAYVGYIILAPTPDTKLDRACAPFFVAPKKAMVAGARLFSPSAERPITEAFDSGYARCRAFGWNVFYEDEYQRMVSGDGGKK